MSKCPNGIISDFGTSRYMYQQKLTPLLEADVLSKWIQPSGSLQMATRTKGLLYMTCTGTVEYPLLPNFMHGIAGSLIFML